MMETSGCMTTLAAKNFLTVLAKGRCNMIMMFAVHEHIFSAVVKVNMYPVSPRVHSTFSLIKRVEKMASLSGNIS